MQPAGAKDPQKLERRTWSRRKAIQAEHQAEYDDAVVALREKVKELEGQDMREEIQDKVGRRLGFRVYASVGLLN